MAERMTSALMLRTMGVLLLLALASRATGQGLQFNITSNTLPTDPDAQAAVTRAADDWTTHLVNAVTVNLVIEMAPLGAGGPFAVAQVGTGATEMLYSDVRNKLVARKNLYPILEYLPTPAQLTAHLPATNFDSTYVTTTRANQKALGLLDGADAGNDGVIYINSDYTYTKDRSGGVAGGTYDLQSIATREIGRLLGFFSNVQVMDDSIWPAASGNAAVIDLFRFSKADKPLTNSEFTNKPREMYPGYAAILTDLAGEYELSTGTQQGDGQPPSSWKDNAAIGGPVSPIGIFDPTLPDGTSAVISAADLLALGLVGWSVPEPGSLTLLCAAWLLLGRRTRRIAKWNSISMQSPQDDRDLTLIHGGQRTFA